MAKPTNGANIASQYLYKGRGPFDSKALVDTKAALLNSATWSISENGKTSVFAYNAMVVSVWKDSTPDNNGVYYFHSPSITNAYVADATLLAELAKESNWHKIARVSDITTAEGGIDEDALNAAIEKALESINSEVDNINTSLGELESNVADNTAALESQAEEIEGINTDLAATKTKVGEIDSALQSIQSKDYDSQISALQGSHNDLANAVAPLSGRITTNASAIAALTTDLDGLEAQFSALDSSALKTSHIEGSTEFTFIDNKLVIGQIDLKKIAHNPKELKLILNGGNASTEVEE